MTTTNIRQAVVDLIAQMDRQIEGLQAARASQQDVLNRLDEADANDPVSFVSTATQDGAASERPRTEVGQSAPQGNAPISADSADAAQQEQNGNSAQAAGAQVAAQEPKKVDGRRGPRAKKDPQAKAASKTPGKRAAKAAAAAPAAASGADAQDQQPTRRKRGPNKKSAAPNVGEANASASGSEQASSTPARRKRGPNKKTIAAKTTDSSTASAPSGDSPAAPARRTRGPNKKTSASADKAPEASAAAEQSKGTESAGTTSSATPAGNLKDIKRDVWPSLLGPRGKSARELARAAARQLNVTADKTDIERLAEDATPVLEELVSSGAAQASGTGNARVFMRP